MTPDDLPWFTVAELAAMNLPGMPSTKRGMQVRSDEENWRDPENKGKTWRDRQASGGGIEYTPYVLPLSARVKVVLDASRSRKSPRLDERKRADLWENYDRCRDDQKERAQNALRVLQAVHALQACGTKGFRPFGPSMLAKII
ncbi:DNA-binding protein [Brytella acorum]|uniref:DNA-binding protein n=1 Tax=Brytella acorum TaxID=2959299 RepID=A0AA35Y344_9PROT|nr:DNA-binding protein [Brytella acorum]CAI9120465.1 DNA-binding protein [Brytella acorum]